MYSFTPFDVQFSRIVRPLTGITPMKLLDKIIVVTPSAQVTD